MFPIVMAGVTRGIIHGLGMTEKRRIPMAFKRGKFQHCRFSRASVDADIDGRDALIVVIFISRNFAIEIKRELTSEYNIYSRVREYRYFFRI